jgi:plastocyanin
MRRVHSSVVRAAVLAIISLSACSGGSGGGYPTGSGGQNPPPGQQPPPSTSNTIAVKNNRFDPATTTISTNTTVTWTWDACTDDGYGGTQTCVDHNVTFDSGGGSPTQSTGSYSRQFTAAGTFNYRCTVHGPAMVGEIVVR